MIRLPVPAAIALGAVIGVGIRWGVFDVAGTSDGKTILVNGIGCFLMGLFVRRGWRDDLHAAATVGLCGGLTTFSTFALDAAVYFDDSRFGQGLLYIGATVLTAAVAYLLGRQLAGVDA
jgi:CrcB protein